MDIKELRKMINEEVNRRKIIKEQDEERTGGARPSNVKSQPTPEKGGGGEEVTRNVPDIQGTTQSNVTGLQLNILFESIFNNPEFSKLHPETKKALQLARDSYNSLISTESELIGASFKNQNGDYQIINDIAEITKKIATIAPKSAKKAAAPYKKSSPEKTSVVSPNKSGQETTISPDASTRISNKPVKQISPDQETQTGLFKQNKRN